MNKQICHQYSQSFEFSEYLLTGKGHLDIRVYKHGPVRDRHLCHKPCLHGGQTFSPVDLDTEPSPRAL